MEMGRIGWHEGIDCVRGEGAWRLAREDRARRGLLGMLERDSDTAGDGDETLACDAIN